MACMEHSCINCDELVFNNSGTGGRCPKCGGTNWYSQSDEPEANYSRRDQRRYDCEDYEDYDEGDEDE